jgi:hypothetical protein
VSGLSLTWSQQAEVPTDYGTLFLFTASVGAEEVTGAVSATYAEAQYGTSFDLDCVSGDDGEALSFGVIASGVLTNYNNAPGDASITFPSSTPVFYLFGSAALYGLDGFSASPGESPTAWTQLAFCQGYEPEGMGIASALQTQVSPDASEQTAVADWSGFYDGLGGWAAAGIPISVS